MMALMSPTVVALLAPMPPAVPRALRDCGHRVVEDPADWPAATVAVTRGSLATGEDTLARMPLLQLLCCWGSGYDGVDRFAAARRHITICHCPSGNASSVADLAVGFVIALMRGLPMAERHLRSGRWVESGTRLPAARGLTGSRLGIFGLGEVGRRVAHRARALEMVVGCFTRRPPVATEIVVFEDLMSLARWADVLVLSARAASSTHHAVDSKVIDALGPQGFLVNVARGDLVDEVSLCAALRDGRLAGYAGDVFEHEPEVPVEMLAFPNAILTPHIGGATHSAQQVMCEALIANIQRFLDTGQAVHAVPHP